MYEKPTNALVIIHDLYYLVFLFPFIGFSHMIKFVLMHSMEHIKIQTNILVFLNFECRSTLYSNLYGDVNNAPPYNVSKTLFFITYNSYTFFFPFTS